MSPPRRCAVALGLVAALAPALALAQATRELVVHVVQGNNKSPYTFVRAKFLPGELSDPWAVRFFDPGGAELPCFIWDSITWQTAREGRPDWGRGFVQFPPCAGQYELKRPD